MQREGLSGQTRCERPRGRLDAHTLSVGIHLLVLDPGPERLGGGWGHQVARCQRRRGPYPWSAPLVTPPEGVAIWVLEHSNN